MKLYFSDDFFAQAMPQKKLFKNLQLKQFEILLLATAELTMISHGQIGISSFLDSPSN